MSFRWYFSIRTKILIVLLALVVPAVGLYLVLASRISFQDKTLLIYELSQNSVRSLGDGAEAVIGRWVDRLRLIGKNQKGKGNLWVEGNQDFARIEIWQGNKREKIFESDAFLADLGLDRSYLNSLRTEVPVKLEEVIRRGVWIASVIPEPKLESDEVPNLLTLAVALSKDTAIVADIKSDRMLELFGSSGIATTYLVGSDGHFLAHSDQKQVYRKKAAPSAGEALDPVVKAARQSKVKTEVKRFEEKDQVFLGAYSRMGFGDIIAVSRISQSEAFAAVRVLVQKSLIYAVVVISSAFLIALFFSHTLTEPIQNMMAATRKIAQGDFSAFIRVDTRDELSVLATSFNSMTSDLKTSRQKIEEYSRDLEKKVEERTAKLEAQQIAIRETQDALARTTRLASVGEVAGRAAHEVLNPLTNMTTRMERVQAGSIQEMSQDSKLLGEITDAWGKAYQEKGFDGLIQSLNVPSQAMPGKQLIDEDLGNLQSIAKDALKRADSLNQDIGFLLKEAGRITKIVNGMRQLTRVSGAKKKVDLHKTIDEAFEAVGDVLKKNKIARERAFSEGPLEAVFDHDELMQVLNNLVRNSVQAIQGAPAEALPAGYQPKVWVTTQQLNGQALIRVSDNGPGISAENAGKIFEPNFSTKTIEEGTGLGLAICRRFVRAYEGEIDLEKSIPFSETTFLIALPLQLEAGESSA
ncbi:MAG: HAMP domain-containing protein [Bdellovibrionales bacterium]|nr:HAMP domain-containing protein [Bdellovibrionales bacterium]